ncbi:cytochrome P450 12b1, mitochondrial-like [Toxorhynchites rutilus septentrionalis]|uniref:cytochrome P450 12b1, mitochondrial-like n=1 Tax=Toxorhynchites rutilus septentrionalis TaxID=329112 RepID=UPI00247B1B07|nr:cytochrome P450 12b1, mitochondrial-like [Toxorhynchites rutilus septentrionalis]
MLRNLAKVYGGYRPSAPLRALSTQPAVDSGFVDTEWENALPYDKIPGPGVMKMLMMFAPGGRYYNATLPELQRRLRQDYGDLVRLPGVFGRADNIMSFSPDDFEKVFRTEGTWPVRRAIDTFVYYRRNVRQDVFKGLGGLVTEQGENWQFFRSIVNPVMLQPKTVKMYVDKLDEVSRDFTKIMKNLRDEKNEMPADFNQWLNRWALETMGVMALDTRLGILEKNKSDEAEHIVKCIREFFQLTYELDVLPSVWMYYKTPKFVRLMRTLDELTAMIMAKVDEALVRLESSPNAESTGQSVLEKLLKVNRDVAIIMAFDMLLAGIDTTASGTIGVLHSLAMNPDKQTKLREELRTILPTKDTPLTPDKMHHLPYLRACIKEGLRLAPPTAGNARAAGKNLVLQGYRVPKGTDIAIASMILQQDDRFFQRAKEFVPERWLKGEKCPSGDEAHPFVFLPFGFGPRTCIGRRLAMLEMEVIIARITREFEYRWNYDELRIRGSLINIPENELKFEMNEVQN